MLFQNKSFHGRHAEEKAALAEFTSAACGGFSRPRERPLRKQKRSVLWYQQMEKATRSRAYLLPLSEMPKWCSQSYMGFIRILHTLALREALSTWVHQLEGDKWHPSCPLQQWWSHPSSVRAANASKYPFSDLKAEQFGISWFLRDGNPEESPSYKPCLNLRRGQVHTRAHSLSNHWQLSVPGGMLLNRGEPLALRTGMQQACAPLPTT